MAELKMEKIVKGAEEAAENIMNKVRSDTGMSLKECYEMQVSQNMKLSNNAEWCPRCTRRLLGYNGLNRCWCKYCGQSIVRNRRWM